MVGLVVEYERSLKENIYSLVFGSMLGAESISSRFHI